MYLLAFHAFLRIGEMTRTGTAKHYLLRGQVIVDNGEMHITFNHFKHSAGTSSKITISSLGTGDMCPVEAISEYIAYRKHSSPDEPLFSFMDSSPIPRSFFTQYLQRSLRWAGLSLAAYKSHSFRIGAASTAAIKGFSESQIQYMGRWKSDAFKKYIRIPSLRL